MTLTGSIIRASLGLVILSVAVSAPLQSQQLRGVVRDSAASVPLAGAVVTELDSAGATVARAITDAGGRFSIVVAPRAASLRLIRIGYRPREVALPADGAVEFRLSMERLPPILDAVKVVGNELCPGSSDRGAAFQLWEQARAGLLATVVARELKPAYATTVVYESTLGPADERVRRQRKRLSRGMTTRPFVASAAPSFFARVGYMLEDGGNRIFNAPDADVLVDPSFATTHCFRLRAADAQHAGQLGLAFVPIPGRDTLVDVAGVIWIDVRNPQLRSLEFAYTSLEPAATQRGAGGAIVFRGMANGVSFIERWHLRLPVLETSGQPVRPTIRREGSPSAASRADRYDLRVAEINETGGMVIEASWPDSTRFAAPVSSVAGVVRRRDGGSATGTIVTLVGTPDTVRVGDGGAFSIATIPGRYTIAAVDTLLASFVAPRSQSADVRISLGAVTSVNLELPSISRVVADVCREDQGRDAAIVVGAVSLAAGELPATAEIVATWQSDYSTGQSGALQVQSRTQVSSFDDRGRFIICGVARERPVLLRLRSGTTPLADTTIRVMTAEPTHTVLWIVRPSSYDEIHEAPAPSGEPPTPEAQPADIGGPRLASPSGDVPAPQGEAQQWPIDRSPTTDETSTDTFAFARQTWTTFSSRPTVLRSFVTTFASAAPSPTRARTPASTPARSPSESRRIVRTSARRPASSATTTGRSAARVSARR